MTEALDYAGRGWAVMPLHAPKNGACDCGRKDCKSPAKHPRLMHGVKDASTDRAKVEDWWSMWPTSNIGIATGAVSGIVVLDIDPRHGGAESLKDLQNEHGPLPDTVECLTGGGGCHYYFAHPGAHVGNKVGLKPGLDLRGDGGYVVAPPSRHISGRDYEWQIFGDPDTAPLAPLPEYLRIPAAGNGKSDAEWENFARQPVVEGTRHDSLATLTGKLLRCRVPEPLAARLVWAFNQQWCSPPLDRDELLRLINDLIKAEHARRARNGQH